MSTIISILIPGATYHYANRALMSFCVPIIGILIVLICSWTRWITDPYLFTAMNGVLLSLHLATFAHGKLIQKKGERGRGLTTLLLLISVTLCLLICGHINKSRLFGFELYHVPSPSMSPTIQVGDIVLSDTWFKSAELSGNEVIVFKRHSRGVVLLKRLQDVRASDKGLELFVVGDNKYRSQDSRSFGWVNAENFIGVVTGALLSLSDKNESEETYPRRIE